MTAVPRGCLIDVYDTILTSFFVARVRALVEPLGIAVDDWLAEWEKTREDRDRGRLTMAASIQRTLPACGVEPVPGLVDDLMRQDMALARSHTRLFDDTIPFLTWLRSQGVLIALVSNCEDTTRGRLGQLGVIPLVDTVVLSCEVGSVKPYPEMYVTALEKLGVAASDAVFIDDQPRYCAGAEALGIRAIQIIRRELDGAAPAPGAFPVVRSLADARRLF